MTTQMWDYQMVAFADDVAAVITALDLMDLTIVAHSMTTTDFRQDLARISVPTMVIHGDRDVSAPLGLTGKPMTVDILQFMRAT